MNVSGSSWKGRDSLSPRLVGFYRTLRTVRDGNYLPDDALHTLLPGGLPEQFVDYIARTVRRQTVDSSTALCVVSCGKNASKL